MQVKSVAFFAVVNALTGCSLLINGTEQKVNISSSVPNATVVVANRWNDDVIAQGDAPLDVTLKRSERSLVVRVSADGHTPVEKNIEHSWSGYCGLDLLFPWAIVPALFSGSCYKFDDVSINLGPSGDSVR